MRPIAVIGLPQAMARPGRPASEAEFVIQAVGSQGSANARASCLARRVAQAAVDYVDADPLDRAVDQVDRHSVSPVKLLATCAEIDTAGLVRAARIKSFEARGTQQLPDRQWRAETMQIVEEVAKLLARRYARTISEHERNRT